MFASTSPNLSRASLACTFPSSASIVALNGLLYEILLCCFNFFLSNLELLKLYIHAPHPTSHPLIGECISRLFFVLMLAKELRRVIFFDSFARNCKWIVWMQDAFKRLFWALIRRDSICYCFMLFLFVYNVFQAIHYRFITILVLQQRYQVCHFDQLCFLLTLLFSLPILFVIIGVAIAGHQRLQRSSPKCVLNAKTNIFALPTTLGVISIVPVSLHWHPRLHARLLLFTFLVGM